MFNKKGPSVMFSKSMIHTPNGGKAKNCGHEDMAKEEYLNKYKRAHITAGSK